MFIQGPDKGLPPIGCGQEAHAIVGHTWLKSSSDRIIDLSPRLQETTSGAMWRSLNFTGVLDGQWQPADSGVVVVCTNLTTYGNAIAEATHRVRLNTAVYWEHDEQNLTADLVIAAMDFVNSPLTDQLRHFRDSEIYSKAALHLIEFVAGKRRAIAGLSHRKAWTIVAAQERGATPRLLDCMGFSVPDKQ